MAIEGLISPDALTPVVPAFNVNDRVELAVTALDVLRLVQDRDQVLKSVRADFAILANTVDRPVETYVQVPFGRGFTPEVMLKRFDAAFTDAPQTYPVNPSDDDFNRQLWLSAEGYALTEINRLDVVEKGQPEPAVRPAQGRVALANGEKPKDPLLYFTGIAYDEKYAAKGETTQLKELAAAKVEFEAQDPRLELNPMNLASVVMLAAQRRIEGRRLPICWGSMHIPQLGRKEVYGESAVGVVSSCGGQLWLENSDGEALPHRGVGLSVGQKSLQEQL